jgi:hypothetical protein
MRDEIISMESMLTLSIKKLNHNYNYENEIYKQKYLALKNNMN